MLFSYSANDRLYAPPLTSSACRLDPHRSPMPRVITQLWPRELECADSYHVRCAWLSKWRCVEMYECVCTAEKPCGAPVSITRRRKRCQRTSFSTRTHAISLSLSPVGCEAIPSLLSFCSCRQPARSFSCPITRSCQPRKAHRRTRLSAKRSRVLVGSRPTMCRK